jgi:uncharacterized protein
MSRPVVLTLFLTHQCNLRCTYCYVHEKRGTKMPIEVGHKAIDLALQLAKEKLQISFFGGEPLLEWELLTDFHQYGLRRTAERGVRPIFALTTNGMLLDEERLTYLRDNDIKIGYSIDGSRQAQDATRPKAGGGSSHERTVDRLRMALEYLPDLQTISVIDPGNVPYLADSVREIMDIGCKRITLNPNWSADWEDEAIRNVWEQQYEEISGIYVECFRKNKPVRISFIEDKVITRLKAGYAPCDQCDFGHLDFAVSTTGKIYPCERQVAGDDDASADMVIGTVDQGFDLRRQRQIQRAVKEIPKECRSCALADRCANWCPCANLALTGEIGRPGGLLCFHEQLSVKWADEAAARLYAEKNAPFMLRFYS